MELNGSQVAIGHSGRPVQRLCAALFVIGLFVASWFVAGTQVAQAILAFIAVVSLMFAVELTANDSQRLSGREYWRVRRIQIGRGLLLRSICLVLFHVIIAWVAFLTLLQMQHPPAGTPMGLLRLAAGVALLYAIAELVFEGFGLCFLAAGYSLPPMHRTPIAARSVGEFWGQRWNIIVSAWLRTYIFWPLARRRRAGVGVLCSFLVSGALHGWPMLAALGTSAAFTTAGFFVIQGVFVLAENRLHIHTWPVAMARAWTLLILLASSPLYIDPGLRLFGF